MITFNQKRQILNSEDLFSILLSFFILFSSILLYFLLSFFIPAPSSAQVPYQTLWHTAGRQNDKPLNRPQGLALSPDLSLIYVADTDNDRVMIFTTTGEAIGPFLTSRPLSRPFDVVIGADGSVYISRMGKRTVEVFDKKGLWQASFPKGADKEGFEFAPGRMDFDHQGRFMVIDRLSASLWIFNKEGKVNKKLTIFPKEKKTVLLTGLAKGPNKNISLTSAKASSVITLIDPAGSRVLSFGNHGALYEDSFSFPSSLAIDNKNRLWVVDAFRHMIKVFDQEGKFLFSLGTYGQAPGKLLYPVDIAIDEKGKVYVLEKGAGRLQAFSIIEEGAE